MWLFTHKLTLSSRGALCAGVAGLGLMMPALAQAQESGAGNDNAYATGNEIIVTATKREQTLQDVPVAVTVTTADMIERAHIRDIRDLSSVVPSLRVSERQNLANATFFIRGFGNGANNAGIEPSVGVFVDGVYRSRSAAQITDLPDVSRVEVLRGPQSTLFGKNASAGVVSIVTEKPKFNFGGNVEASYGNYDAMVVKGVVTGPIMDSLAVSLAGGVNKRDGYIRDLGTGNRTNERNRWFVRGQALFEPTDNLSIRVIGDYSKINENCCGVSNLELAAPTQVLIGLGGQVNDPARAFDNVVYTNIDATNRIKNYGISGQIDYKLGDATITSITAWRRSKNHANFDSDFTSADLLQGANVGRSDIKTFTQELRFAGTIGDKINILAGGFYFKENIRQASDLNWGVDARPFANALVQSLSQGSMSIPALEAMFGQLSGDPSLYTGKFFEPQTGLYERFKMKNESYSLFGQVDFEVTDRLTLTGGIAYTNDKKRFASNVLSTDTFAGLDLVGLRNAATNAGISQTVGSLMSVPGGFASAAQIQSFAAANPTQFQMIQAGAANATAPLLGLKQLQYFPPFLNFPNPVEPGRTKDDKFTYTARVAYDVSPAVNVYASYATGFKASSINLSRDSRPFPGDQAALIAAGMERPGQTYGSRYARPENSTVYEAGIKGNWGVATANFAVFQQSIKGFQSNLFTGTGFLLTNAGKQSVFGLEFEGTVKPTRGLTLGLSLTYLDPKYNSYRSSAVGDLSGTQPADIPEISTTFSAAYEHELGNGDRMILAGNYHYESKTQIVEGMPAFIDRTQVDSSGALLPAAYIPAKAAARGFTREVDELDASLTYAMQNGLELSVWGRNLLNDRYIHMVFDSPAQPGSISGYINQPRTYGVSARFRW